MTRYVYVHGVALQVWLEQHLLQVLAFQLASGTKTITRMQSLEACWPARYLATRVSDVTQSTREIYTSVSAWAN